MRTRFRNYLYSFVALAAVVGALWGCSGSSNSNNDGITCQSNGVCYNSSGVPVSGTGVPGLIYQSNGYLQITNQVAWNTFLRGSQACMTAINSCAGLNGPPGVTINLIDPTFSGGYSAGNMTIEAQGIQLPYNNIYYRPTGSGFATGIQTGQYIQINPNNTNTGSLYYVYVTGSPTVAVGGNLQVQITTNAQTIATGTLVRIQ